MFLFLCRGRGAIVTVSSGACSMPTPQMTAYAATKVDLNTKLPECVDIICLTS